MRKAAWFFLSAAFMVHGCGSDSNPAAPAPLEKTDLVAAWNGTASSQILEWDDVSIGGTETHVLTDVRWRLTIADASYNLEVTSYMGSKSYEAEQWGFWVITDAAAGSVRFSPQNGEQQLVQESNGSGVNQRHTGRMKSWTCKAALYGSTLLLTELTTLNDLRTDSLSRAAQ